MQTVLCFNPLASLFGGSKNMAIFYGVVVRQIFMLIMQTTNLQLWIKYEGKRIFVLCSRLSTSSGLALVSLHPLHITKPMSYIKNSHRLSTTIDFGLALPTLLCYHLSTISFSWIINVNCFPKHRLTLYHFFPLHFSSRFL